MFRRYVVALAHMAAMGKSPRAGSKTAFILSHGDKPAEQIVAAGKAAGMSFSDKFVYAARSKAKRAAGGSVRQAVGIAKRAAAARAKLASKGVATVAPSRAAEAYEGGNGGSLVASGSLERQFALAIELGISRAEAILGRVRAVLGELKF